MPTRAMTVIDVEPTLCELCDEEVHTVVASPRGDNLRVISPIRRCYFLSMPGF
jgi:hypothetical protein